MARLRLRLVRGHCVAPPRERRREARRKHTSDGDGDEVATNKTNQEKLRRSLSLLSSSWLKKIPWSESHKSDGDGLRLVAYASESAPSQENDGATAREREGEEHGRLSDP